MVGGVAFMTLVRSFHSRLLSVPDSFAEACVMSNECISFALRLTDNQRNFCWTVVEITGSCRLFGY